MKTSHQSLSNSTDSLNSSNIFHRNFRRALDETLNRAQLDPHHRIRLLIGPPGVGKSQAAQVIVKQTIDKSLPEMQSQAGLIPAVWLEAPAVGEPQQNDRLFHIQLLAALGDHSFSNKVAYGIDPRSNRLVRPRGMSRNGNQGLRIALSRALRARKTRRLVLDEAIHLFDPCQPQQVVSQLDRLKALSAASGCDLILVGGYDLYLLLCEYDVSDAGLDVVEFPRYRSDSPDDFVEFANCVGQMKGILPQLWGHQLQRHSRALFANSLGCVGSLSNILIRSAKLAEAEGCWQDRFLKNTLLSKGQHRFLLEEIQLGEAAVQRQLEGKKQRMDPNHSMRGAA